MPPRANLESAFKAAKTNWDMHLYGNVVHSFTNSKAAALGRPEFARYDAHADNESFASMARLFQEVLGK